MVMRALISGIFLFLAAASQAQTLVLKDRITRQPIELVTVVSFEPKALTSTDSKGRVQLHEFSKSDSIVFQLLGYQTVAYSYRFLTDSLDGTLYLDQGSFTLDQFTISAARWRQEKRDIPSKISTISPEQVELQNPQTAADLLKTGGEVYVQKSQLGGGSPMIRGFATNRVMLSVDGVRMNNAIFRSGNVQNVISLDAFAVEHTEVVFGPGSVIYGSDAIGGVMSFYTLQPDLAIDTGGMLVSGNAVARISSANFERTGHIDFNIGTKKWGFATSATFSDFDDLIMGSNGPDDYLRPEYITQIDGVDSVVSNGNSRRQAFSGYDQVNLMQKIRYRPNDDWDIIYGGHYSTTSDYPRYDRLIRYQNGTLRSAEWFYGPQEWTMHILRVINTTPNRLYDKMSITAAYQSFGESRHNRDYRSTTRTNRIERVDAGSINADFEQDLGKRHEVFYGLEGVYNHVRSTGIDEDINTGVRLDVSGRYPNGATWSSAAAYLTERFRVNEKLTLLAGARYTMVQLRAKFDTAFHAFPFQEANLDLGALNGSLGAAYKPTDLWQWNINLSTGFRAPNIDDVGKVFDSEPSAVVVPNPDLGAEYAYNAEVGMVKIFGKRLKLDATVYYTFLNNALVRRNAQFNGQDSILYDGQLSQVQSVQNAAQAVVYGIQTGFELKLPKGFGLSTRFNYQKGEEELDNGSVAPMRHVPPMFGVARLTYQRERLRAETYLEYNGEVSNQNLAPSEQNKDYIYALDGNGNPYAPAWYTINAKLAYQVTDAFMVTGGVENILDVRYLPYASGIAAPGRNFIASVKWTF